MSVRGLSPPHAQPYMIFHPHIIKVTSIFINPTKPYRITDKRLFMSDRFVYIEYAQEYKKRLESLDLSLLDDLAFSEATFKHIVDELKFAYRKCYSLALTPRMDFIHVMNLVDLSKIDFVHDMPFRNAKLTMLDFFNKFIEYVQTLEDFDDIASNAVSYENPNAFWYNADDDMYFHLRLDYDDRMALMRIYEGKIEKLSPQEFMKYAKRGSLCPVSPSLFYYKFNLCGITWYDPKKFR